MNTKFSIHHIVTLLLIAPLGVGLLSAPAQAKSSVAGLHYPNPTTVAEKDDKGPRKPAPKPGPRDGGDGE